jgi:hypothetical protein
VGVPFDWKGIDLVELWQSGVRASTSRVLIPYRNADGSTHNHRVIGIRCGRWWDRRGVPLRPFGLERLPDPVADHRSTELVVCEGESDTMTVRFALAQRDRRRVFALGVPGAACWAACGAAQHVRAFPFVYVAGDGDQAGRRLADDVLRDVPWARRVAIPRGEDVRSVVACGGGDALADLMDQADERAHLFAVWRAARTIDRWVPTYLAGGRRNG